MTSASSQHIYNPRFCALACDLCMSARLTAMGAGSYGPRHRQMPVTTTQPRAPSARRVTRPFATAATRAQMASTQSQPLRRSKRLAIPLAHAQTHKVSKPAPTKPRPRGALALPSPPPPPTPDTANTERIILKLRWTPVLVIPAPEAEDQRIRAGPRRLILDPEWREQKRRSWAQNRANLEHK